MLLSHKKHHPSLSRGEQMESTTKENLEACLAERPSLEDCIGAQEELLRRHLERHLARPALVAVDPGQNSPILD